MKEAININIYNVVGKNLCVEAEDGEKVFNLVKKALNSDKNVAISFKNIEMLTSAFLNTAIGQLYKYFSEEEIKSRLFIIDIEPEDRALLKRVISTAKLYYRNKNKEFEDSIKEIMDD